MQTLSVLNVFFFLGGLLKNFIQIDYPSIMLFLINIDLKLLKHVKYGTDGSTGIYV